MTPVHDVLSRLKFRVSRSLSPKAYWFLMGKLKPVDAVTSECATLAESLESGRDVVALLDRLGLIDSDSATLHIGSGLGRVEQHLAPRVRQCYGVDVSPSMVAKARETVRHPNVEFICTDGTALPDPAGGPLDLVYSFLVFQHLPRPQFHRYVGDTWTRLATGGHLVFQIKIDEAGRQPEPPPNHPYGLRYYTRDDVTRLLRSNGFDDIVRVGFDGEPDDKDGNHEDVVFCATKVAR